MVLRSAYESPGTSQRPTLWTVSGGEVRNVTRAAFILLESVNKSVILMGVEYGVIWFLRVKQKSRGLFIVAILNHEWGRDVKSESRSF